MASESNNSNSHSRSDSPVLIIQDEQDETMKQLSHLGQVTLDVPDMAHEVICDYVHSSLVTSTGTIFNFVNSSCPGAASVIGALRINLSDPRKIPAYVQQNKDKIKLHAINALERHLRESRCSVGAAEDLTVDDYGLTFSLASVTAAGAELNPFKRHEGPLYFCLFPNLCEATCLKVECWDTSAQADMAFIVNTYIHLLLAIQRRNRVIARLREEVQSQPGAMPIDAVHRKKPKLAASASHAKSSPMTYGQKRDAEHKALLERYTSLELHMAKLEKQRLLTNPPLPPTKGVVWPPKSANEPEMPDDL